MPRTKESNQKIREERRAQILKAALIVFSAKGLSSATIADIAGQSGISQGLLYHYYNSKEEIFTALIRSAIERMNEAAMQLELLKAAPADKLRMAVDALFSGIESNEETAKYYLLLTQAAVMESVPAEARELLKLKNLRQHEVMSRIFADGQQQGTVHSGDPGQLSMLFWSAINGLALIKAVRAETFQIPDPELFCRMFLNENQQTTKSQ